MKKTQVIYPSLGFTNCVLLFMAFIWITLSIYYKNLNLLITIFFIIFLVLLLMPRWAVKIKNDKILICRYFLYWKQINTSSIQKIYFKFSSRDSTGTIFLIFTSNKKAYRIPIDIISKQIIALNHLISIAGFDKIEFSTFKELEKKDILFNSLTQEFHYK